MGKGSRLQSCTRLTALVISLGAVIVMAITLGVVLQYGACYVVAPLGEALPEAVVLLVITPILGWCIALELQRLLAPTERRAASPA